MKKSKFEMLLELLITGVFGFMLTFAALYLILFGSGNQNPSEAVGNWITIISAVVASIVAFGYFLDENLKHLK